MRFHTVPWLLLVLVTGGLGQASDSSLKTARSGPTSSSRADWREGEVIVAFHEEIDMGSVEKRLRSGGAVTARPARQGSVYLVSLEPGMPVPDAVSQYRGMDGVDYVEPNGILRKSQGTRFTPNDEFFDFQWNMALLNAERTWAIQQGSSSVGVAILDTGVAFEDHVDPVTGQVFAKAPDWGNVTFLPGFDAVNRDSHPNDDEWHGTHVASTVAEGTNNMIDLTGLAFGCAIMPVKVLDESGEGSFFEVAAGIDYAASYTQGGERPVKVINMSLGTEGFSETVKRAVDRASANGIVIVAAAGNTGKAGIDFPARLENVIAVGAVDARGERASYSSTGAELDLMAPGGDCDRDDNDDDFGDCVYQQMPDIDFVTEGIYTEFCLCGLDGTSMAAPHVSAAAALLISQGITDPDAVQAALEQTAEKIGGAPEGGRNDSVGYGLIQPAAALSGLGLNQGPVD
jgi:serine protease